jgi:hypothetical protein
MVGLIGLGLLGIKGYLEGLEPTVDIDTTTPPSEPVRYSFSLPHTPMPTDSWTPPSAPGQEPSSWNTDVPGFSGIPNHDLAPNVQDMKKIPDRDLGRGETPHPTTQAVVDSVTDSDVRDFVSGTVLGSGVQTHANGDDTNIRGMGGMTAAEVTFEKALESGFHETTTAENRAEGVRVATDRNDEVTISVRAHSTGSSKTRGGEPTVQVTFKNKGETKKNFDIKKRFE